MVANISLLIFAQRRQATAFRLAGGPVVQPPLAAWSHLRRRPTGTQRRNRAILFACLIGLTSPTVRIGPLKLLKFLASFCQTTLMKRIDILRSEYNLRLQPNPDDRCTSISIFAPIGRHRAVLHSHWTDGLSPSSGCLICAQRACTAISPVGAPARIAHPLFMITATRRIITRQTTIDPVVPDDHHRHGMWPA
jgi:hypothetical protein